MYVTVGAGGSHGYDGPCGGYPSAGMGPVTVGGADSSASGQAWLERVQNDTYDLPPDDCYADMQREGARRRGAGGAPLKKRKTKQF